MLHTTQQASELAVIRNRKHMFPWDTIWFWLGASNATCLRMGIAKYMVVVNRAYVCFIYMNERTSRGRGVEGIL